jgi:hypothetical protein
MYKPKLRPALIGVVCSFFMILIAGCFQAGNPSSLSQNTTQTTQSTTATTVSIDTINPLTGIADIKSGDWTRPIAVMIGNNGKSRPQIGIEKADVYLEAETEGGITRIMAVFAGASRVPDELGPIRSARTPFIKIAESLGAVYCHAGGSRTGFDLLKTADVGDIDALHGSNSSTFWRDSGLKKTKGQEYSMLTSGSKLSARIKSLKFSTSFSKASPFNFNKLIQGTGAGNKVQITMSAAQTISFDYDPVTELYFKSNGSLEKGSPHVTKNGETLTASNVIVIYDEKYSENEKTIGFRLVSGSGILVSGGTSRQIRWNRTKDRLQLTENDGTVLNLTPGKSYICLTDKRNSSKTILS